MEIRGRIHNGVVVLEGSPPLPEGALVTVSFPASGSLTPHGPRKRVQLPLVPSKRPGSVDLTAEKIAEFLGDDDVASS